VRQSRVVLRLERRERGGLSALFSHTERPPPEASLKAGSNAIEAVLPCATRTFYACVGRYNSGLGHTVPERRPNEADRIPNADRYVFSDQVGYLLRRAYQRHLAIFQANAGDPQLTAVQFSTLCALKDSGPQSQSELVKATSVDQGTIRGIIDRLKNRGLIAFSKDGSDARKVIVSITAAGLRLLESMVPHARDVTELTLKPLNPAERMALLHTLRLLGDDTGTND
jgi:DNA-binding MarR family transcriptional regulator